MYLKLYYNITGFKNHGCIHLSEGCIDFPEKNFFRCVVATLSQKTPYSYINSTLGSTNFVVLLTKNYGLDERP